MALMSGYLSAELAATCNALGYYDGSTYHLEPHCKETLKDLIRYLRRDGNSHEIRRYLGNAQLVKTDLLPIIQYHFNDLELFDVALRLLVNLSNPALLVYSEIIPADKCEHNEYMELISHLQYYKDCFHDHNLWIPFTERLTLLLNKPTEDRDDDDQRLIERILILIRNVLHVPASSILDWRPDNDASIHDQVIWALHQSGMLDILMYMISSENEVHFYLHLLEIICLMVREQPPALLAQTSTQRSNDEKFKDEQELLKIREMEIQEKLKKQKKYLGTRHSNFGGTFVVKNMKSTSDKDMIYHKRIQEAEYITFDQEKQKSRIPKNKQALKHDNVERRSVISVRLVLKQFCVEILHAAYNPLMNRVRELISRGKSQDNDETYYFTALKFFMEFNRFYKFQVKFVSETMAIETFHFAQKYLETWYEMMNTDKKKLKLWSFRIHIALKAYKELLQNLVLMDRSDDSSVRESSKVIKSNIFYVLEYREMLLFLAKTYKKQQFSKQYLVDLMETIHIFLKLICDFCKNKKILVQKKKSKRKHKKKTKPASVPTVSCEEIWNQNEHTIAECLKGQIEKDVVPFDATLDIDIEQQKFEAVKKIHSQLKSGNFEEAIALFRASREIWPENNTFGSENTSPDEELASLKEVFLADLGSDIQIIPEEIENDSYDEEEECIPQVLEQNFDIMDLIKRFATPKIIQICCQLLDDFERNTDFTNRSIVKMLHRIAWDCKLPGLLFQASLFIKFQKILRVDNPKYTELGKLAIFITRKFVEMAEKNKLIFAEMLFLKNTKEAYELEEGYGSSKQKSKPKGFWEEHEEEELRTLSMEYENTKPPQPMIDWIMDNMIRKDRSKRGVIKKLKEMYLIVDNKSSNKWTEELDEELKSLYIEFKNAEDPVASISERLSEERTRRSIASALLRLGLIQDKKEVSKNKKNNQNKSRNVKSDSESDIEDSDSDDEPPPEVAPKVNFAVQKLFQALQDKKFLAEGLKWISSCIDDCLEDLDENDSTDVPLLPLMEDSMLSVENKEFKDFLWSLNFQKPFQQQEIYWRMPAVWKIQDFNQRKALINFITDNFENGLATCAQEINKHILLITGEVQNVEIENQDLEEFHRDIAQHSKETLNRHYSSDEESQKRITSDSDSEPRSSKRRFRTSLSSDEETIRPECSHQRSARRIIDSDSETDTPKKHIESQIIDNLFDHQRIDFETKSQEKQRILDSDSDSTMNENNKDSEEFNRNIAQHSKETLNQHLEAIFPKNKHRTSILRESLFSDEETEKHEDYLEATIPTNIYRTSKFRASLSSDDEADKCNSHPSSARKNDTPKHQSSSKNKEKSRKTLDSDSDSDKRNSSPSSARTTDTPKHQSSCNNKEKSRKMLGSDSDSDKCNSSPSSARKTDTPKDQTSSKNKEKLRKFFDSDSDSDKRNSNPSSARKTDTPKHESSSKNKEKSRKMLDSDSDSDKRNSSPSSARKTDTPKDQTSIKNKEKSRKMLDSDSDSDFPMNESNIKENIPSQTSLDSAHKRDRDSDNESLVPTKRKKRLIIDSDDD